MSGRPRGDGDDLWESHAGWWQEGFTGGVDPEYTEQILPPAADWRIGPYLTEDETVEEVEKGVCIPFIHRPLSRYLNALSDTGLVLVRTEEPAPPPGFIARAREYEAAATIPRLLFLRCEKPGTAP